MYRIVATSNTSCFEPHPGFYRLLMKGIFDAYVLWPLEKIIFFEFVTRVNTPDFVVCRFSWQYFCIFLLKVSYFRKDLLKFSFEPKNERKISLFLPWRYNTFVGSSLTRGDVIFLWNLILNGLFSDTLIHFFINLN